MHDLFAHVGEIAGKADFKCMGVLHDHARTIHMLTTG